MKVIGFQIISTILIPQYLPPLGRRTITYQVSTSVVWHVRMEIWIILAICIHCVSYLPYFASVALKYSLRRYKFIPNVTPDLLFLNLLPTSTIPYASLG